MRPKLRLLFSSLLLLLRSIQAAAQIGPVGGELTVAQAPGVFHRSPAVAGSETGGFVVVWQRYAGDSGGWDIAGRVYNRDGVPLGSEFTVNTTTARMPAAARGRRRPRRQLRRRLGE